MQEEEYESSPGYDQARPHHARRSGSAAGRHTRVVLPINDLLPTLGMREEDWPTTPEAIAALLARMEQMEPGWLSPEDDAAWRAALRAQNESEKTAFLEEAEKLSRIWE